MQRMLVSIMLGLLLASATIFLLSFRSHLMLESFYAEFFDKTCDSRSPTDHVAEEKRQMRTYSIKDGFLSDDISEIELPHTMDKPPKVVACWRAHLDIYRQMLDSRIATAIVFEDDADWDVSLKQQLLRFGRGSRYITGYSQGLQPASQYEEDWDYLQIGHCASQTWPDDHRRFVISDDPAVVPPEARGQMSKPGMHHWDGELTYSNQTRIIFRNSDVVCTFAYIISDQGAAKALQYMSLSPFNLEIDLGIGRFCNTTGNTCIASHPPLIGFGRPAGSTSKFSDIQAISEGKIEEEARSDGLMFSTKLNVGRLLKGEKVMGLYPKPDGERWLLDVDEIGQLMGEGEALKSSSRQ